MSDETIEGFAVHEAPDTDEEVLELEYAEDDIVYYLVDDDDNEIGFAVLDENGSEVEYLYAADDEAGPDIPQARTASAAAHADAGKGREACITRDQAAQATSDLNEVFHAGKDTAVELKAVYDDIKDAFDFKSIFK